MFLAFFSLKASTIPGPTACDNQRNRHEITQTVSLYCGFNSTKYAGKFLMWGAEAGTSRLPWNMAHTCKWWLPLTLYARRMRSSLSAFMRNGQHHGAVYHCCTLTDALNHEYSGLRNWQSSRHTLGTFSPWSSELENRVLRSRPTVVILIVPRISNFSLCIRSNDEIRS